MTVLSARPMTFAAAGLVLTALLAAAPAPAVPGEPVPDLAIILMEIPGGITRRTLTDKNGVFLFDRLAPGQYVLRLGPIPVATTGTAGTVAKKAGTEPRAMSESHTSSKENIKPTSALPGGGTRHTIDFEVSPTVIQGKDLGTTITIARGGGQITGRVTKGPGWPIQR